MSSARVLGCALAVLLATACTDDDGVGPSRAGLTLVVPNPVEGRLVSCATCQEPTTSVVLEFPVTVGDPEGPGGTLERIDTVVVNASRGGEIARNTRPNTDYAFPATAIPPGGSMTVQGGAVFGVPPPRDEIRVTVIARATDGRATTATVPLVIIALPAAEP